MGGSGDGPVARFWGRAMGWYAMGLVDTLDFLPAGHPGRAELVGILRRLAEAVVRVQDARSAASGTRSSTRANVRATTGKPPSPRCSATRS